MSVTLTPVLLWAALGADWYGRAQVFRTLYRTSVPKTERAVLAKLIRTDQAHDWLNEEMVTRLDLESFSSCDNLRDRIRKAWPLERAAGLKLSAEFPGEEEPDPVGDERYWSQGDAFYRDVVALSDIGLVFFFATEWWDEVILGKTIKATV